MSVLPTPPTAIELLPESSNPLDDFNDLKRFPTTDFATNTRTKFTGHNLYGGYAFIYFQGSNWTANAYWSDICEYIEPKAGAKFISEDGTLKAGSYLFAIQASFKSSEGASQTMKEAIINLGWDQGANGLLPTRTKYSMFYASSAIIATNTIRSLFIRRDFSEDTRLRFNTEGANAKFSRVHIYPLDVEVENKDFYDLAYSPKGIVKGRDSFYWSKIYSSSGANNTSGYIKDKVLETYYDNQIGNEFLINSYTAGTTDREYRDMLGNIPATNFTYGKWKDHEYGKWHDILSTYRYNNGAPATGENRYTLERTFRGSEEAPLEANHEMYLQGGGYRGYTYGYCIRTEDYVDIKNVNPLTTRDLTTETFVSPVRYESAPLVRESFYFTTKRVVGVSTYHLDFLDFWVQKGTNYFDPSKTRWSKSLFNGRWPKVAFVTIQPVSAPTSLERSYLEAGWGVVNEYTLPETPIGIGNVFSGLVMFRYPDAGANPIDRPPALTIQCEDGILPAIEIEMHVLEWKE